MVSPEDWAQFPVFGDGGQRCPMEINGGKKGWMQCSVGIGLSEGIR